MDRLEEYIRTNRDGFDDKNPDPMIWEHISARLPHQARTVRHVVMWKWMTAAAVTLALMMSGVVAGMYMGSGRTIADPAYADFLQAQEYYNMEYNKKKSELEQYVSDPEVERDLQDLDLMHDDLSQQLLNSTSPDKTELINAMIEVYRTRIKLLERVLNKVERNKSENTGTQEDEIIKI